MRGLGILLALALAVAASACGGSGPTAEQAPQDAIVLAASKTNDAGTYKADMTGTVNALGQSVTMSGTGAFDTTQERGTMSITTSIAGQDLDMQIVYALRVMYMRFPAGLLPGLPADKPWVKMDLEKLGRQAGFDFQQLMQTQQADPSQGLKYLEGVSDVQAVGDEDVRGVPTTHYKGFVDLNALADKHPELQPSIDQLVRRAGISRIPMEVWVDENNFVRQMKESFNVAGADTDFTIQLYDYGTSVDVAPPPANETIDFAELLDQS